MSATGGTAHDHLLTPAEVRAMFDSIDKDANGLITFEELESMLAAVHEELAPQPKPHHLHHPLRRELEKGTHAGEGERDGLHRFLHSLMPDCGNALDWEEFEKTVNSWQVPSMEECTAHGASEREYERKLSWRRRARAQWSVKGPKVLFMTLVVSLQLAMGIWQMVTYIRKPDVRRALGWGVILAKASAGALYPTLFMMLLSMSRHLATFLRRFQTLSAVVNWDRSQSFHVQMSIAGLALASLHAIGHLTGTFLYGSRPAQQDDLAIILGADAVPKSYRMYVSTLPGWSGLVSLGLFYTIAALSMPRVRKWSYELFQLGHLLMIPMIGFLCAHGTARLLQAPMLGYWLAVPALSVLYERGNRLARGFFKIKARVEVLDDDTVCLTLKHPRDKWDYEAGQYILLQVPSISWWQWHPFTVSTCRGGILQVHIKTDGDWTSQLRDLPVDSDITVGVDGPFGAPAQRFYDYDRSLIIGAGVGITPFSAILTDLEATALGERPDPWLSRRSSNVGEGLRRTLSRTKSVSGQSSPAVTRVPSRSGGSTPLRGASGAEEKDEDASSKAEGWVRPARRVDFHWMVRDKNYLLWFSLLLNRAADLAAKVPSTSSDRVELNIHTHITAKRSKISTHVFRYLLDRYRTPSAPYSALTGLKTTSHFGRPDFDTILNEYHEDSIKQGWIGGKVGVFFCGAPAIGVALADRCELLTARGLEDGSRIKYVFLMEVFG